MCDQEPILPNFLLINPQAYIFKLLSKYYFFHMISKC